MLCSRLRLSRSLRPTMFAATCGRGGSDQGPPSIQSHSRADEESNWQQPSSASRGAPRGLFANNRRFFGTRDLRGVPRRWSDVEQPHGRDLLEGLLRHDIETLRPPKPMNIQEVELENVRYLASYSWVDVEKPTVVVSGESLYLMVYAT